MTSYGCEPGCRLAGEAGSATFWFCEESLTDQPHQPVCAFCPGITVELRWCRRDHMACRPEVFARDKVCWACLVQARRGGCVPVVRALLPERTWCPQQEQEEGVPMLLPWPHQGRGDWVRYLL